MSRSTPWCSSHTTLSFNIESNRKNGKTQGQWQILLWTSAKQTSLSVKSEKSSFLRKMLSKYWNCYRKKYLTIEKYLEDPRRCKIKFWTTFVFFTKLIFPLPLELESFKDFRKYLDKKYLALKYCFFKSSIAPLEVKISIWWRKQKLSRIWFYIF